MMSDAPRLLTDRQADAVRRVRSVLQDLLATVAALGVHADDQATLRGALDQLDDFFLLVVVGEFNSGKSALINALLGEPVVLEGVTPTTADVQVIQHAGAPAVDASGIRRISATAPLLRDLHIVDTPGTNAIARAHEVLTRRFVPRADLILFVTSADRPFTESERQFLVDIREWGKNVVLIINKGDLLRTAEERREVRAFVRDNVQALLGISPELFVVSARTALAAKTAGDAGALDASGLPGIERFILDSLTAAERFRLKLLSPIGVARVLADRSAATVAARLDLLKDDAATVDEVRTQLDGFRRDMRRGFDLRFADIDNVLHEFEQRGYRFFDDTVRVGRIVDLMNRSRIRLEFERDVIGDLPQRIQQRVEDVIDWMVTQDLQQWRLTRDRLAERRSRHADRIAGQLAGGFEYDRRRLLDTVGKATQDALDAHDERAEAARMAESVRTAVANAALLEVGAVGLGTAVSLLATSTAADVTGILAAGLLATIGFVVLPRRRQTAKRDLRARVAAMRQQLMSALTAQFEREIAHAVRRIEDAIAPYLQFVDAERAALDERQRELGAIQARLSALAAEARRD
jgi:small GTP-binding protein